MTEQVVQSPHNYGCVNVERTVSYALAEGVPTLPAIAAWTGQQVEAKAEILWYAIMCM
jgi:hypothetical protein